MQYLFLIAFLSLVIFILAIIYDVNLKKLKQFAKDEEAKFNPITEKYPSNVEICKHILNKLNNNKVKIEEDENANTCLYIALTDKIIIANLKKSYTRIQTIAHECLHSIQNRKILLFNFIFSNIYLLYFAIITILRLFKIIPKDMIFVCIMIFLSYIYYFVRSYLEDDAMTKARFLAKEYLEETNKSSKEEIDKIIESYDKLNDIGIKATNYDLMFGTIIKTIVVTIVFLL